MKKHTALQTISLHLLPGIIQLSIKFSLLIPLALYWGFASDFGGDIVTVVLVFIQFGILLFVAKKTTGTYKITKLMPYTEHSKMTEYLLFIVVIGAWALIVGNLLYPLEEGLRDGLFSFVPDSLKNVDTSLIPKSKLLFAACFDVLVNGIIAPVTEELYFRGFLLPRIKLSPNMAVVASAVLFSIYHFFSPWYFFSRVLMTLPIYYWVIKRKNIRFSIIAHIIANLTYSGSILLQLLFNTSRLFG